MRKSALPLVLFLSGCIGYGEFISPAQAQQIELDQCKHKLDAESKRVCYGQVARKYERYNSEGGYPEIAQPPSPRQ